MAAEEGGVMDSIYFLLGLATGGAIGLFVFWIGMP